MTIDRVNSEEMEKDLSQCQFGHHKSKITTELNMGPLNQKPATG
jgi:hypothetical protein